MERTHANASHLFLSNRLLAFPYPHIVLKEICAFFHVFTTTPIHKRRDGDLEKLKNMPQMTWLPEREMEFNLPNLRFLSNALSRRRAYVGMSA